MLTDHPTLRIHLPAKDWHTSNQRNNKWEDAKKTSDNRLRGKLASLAALRTGRLPRFTRPVQVYAAVALPTARTFDPPNAWPTVKAILDGLTDAHIWDDDSHIHVPLTAFFRAPGKSPKGTYTVTLYFVEERTHDYIPF